MNLINLRKKILISQNRENKDINKVLKWLILRNKVNKMKVRKVPIKQLDSWYIKKNGNLH